MAKMDVSGRFLMVSGRSSFQQYGRRGVSRWRACVHELLAAGRGELVVCLSHDNHMLPIFTCMPPGLKHVVNDCAGR